MVKQSDAAPEGSNKGRTAAPTVTAKQVAAYLRRHPEFLLEHPSLLDGLEPPTRDHGDGVVDLQQVMVKRLRDEVEKLGGMRDDLLETSRGNANSQDRIHRAIIALLEAPSFERFIECVTTDLAVILDLDLVTIGVEQSDQAFPSHPAPGVYCLDPGQVEALLGPSNRMLLRENVEGEPAIYGSGASLVRSDALIRLAIGEAVPAAILAMASRGEDRFHSAQGTELLSFLARVLEISFRKWLNVAPS
ncbi:MAG TPA: DUF484 family protein [Kiloniellaceae bacterium]|nr:DUF484 family protein [Kiloniellaceae bacterium]